MRKALKAATLMGLAAALIVPAVPGAKAADMDMGSTKVTIGGQLRERLEWWGSEVGTGKGAELGATYRARLNIKAELSDGVTAVFTPQAVGYWGENGQGLGLGESTSFTMHEAYLLLSNPFGINDVIVKMGRQEVNLGNQRLVGSVGWSQAGRSLDGILVGYVAGDYGLAGFFYGKLNDAGKQDAWFRPTAANEPDIDLYVATWQGKFKPFGIGGTYELTDIYVNPTSAFTKAAGVTTNLTDVNVNTIYGRVTPAFEIDFAKVKLNLEAAKQSGTFGSANFKGYMFSVGAGADFDQVAWTPSVFVGYDYYSGDSDNTGDIKAFWSVLPTAHKWLGHADAVWVNTPFYQFNGTGLINVAKQYVTNANGDQFNIAGVKDLYFKLHTKPFEKVALGVDFHYFKAAKTLTDLTTGQSYGKDIGWETDVEAKYKYSKNLCLSLGYDYFNPNDAFKAFLGNDKAEHHVWAQADLKF
ncbi:alginate export family protein [Thermovibrio sp.]